LVKIARVVPEISSQTDRQTDTDTDKLITILLNRSRGRSYYCVRSTWSRPNSQSEMAEIIVVKFVCRYPISKLMLALGRQATPLSA